jgi:polar amino acid transport system substrate-binding protein
MKALASHAQDQSGRDQPVPSLAPHLAGEHNTVVAPPISNSTPLAHVIGEGSDVVAERVLCVRETRSIESTKGGSRMAQERFVTVALLVGVTAAVAFGMASVARADDAKCEPDKVAAKYPSLKGKTIKVATDAESPPYSFRDPKDFNNIVGIDVDMARATFKCIGVPIEFSTGAWSGLLPSVLAGQADLMWDDLYYTAERGKQADYVLYMVAGTGGMVKKGNPKNIHAMSDACGLTGTAGLGTVEEAGMRDESKKCVADGKKEISIMTYPDMASGARLVQNDRADLMVTDLGVVDQLSHDNPTLYERGFKVVSDFRIGVAVKKGNTDLANALYDAIRTLHADGTQKGIFDKYSVDNSLIVDPELRNK